LLTSLTATTDFFLRPTTNRFVACSSNSAGSSPGGGGPTRRSGWRAAAGIGALFGSSMTSIIVPIPFDSLSGAPVRRAAVRWSPSVRGSRCPVGHQKAVDPIRPTARVSAGGHPAVRLLE